MASTNPEKLKNTKSHSLRMIALAMARQPVSGRLFLGGSDFTVYAADPTDAKFALRELGKHESYVSGVAVAGNAVVSGGYDGRLSWWDIDKGGAIRTIEAHTKWIRNVIASPDGKCVVSVADDMVCRVWEAASGKSVHELRGHKERTPNHFPSMLFNAAFTPDGRHLATADKVGHIVVWDVAAGKEVKTLEAPGFYTWDGRQRIHSIGGPRGLAFSPDGKTLAVGGIGLIGNVDHLEGPARIEVFDWQEDKKSRLFDKTKHKGLVNRLAFAPDGSWLLGAGGAGNGFLIFIDLKTNKVVKEENAKFHIHAVALNEAGDTIYAAGHNGYAEYEVKG